MSPSRFSGEILPVGKLPILCWTGDILSGSMNAARPLIQSSLKVEAFSQTNFPMG